MIVLCAYSVLFLPLIGAIFSGFFGRYFKPIFSYWVTSCCVGLAGVASFYLLWLAAHQGVERIIEVAPWLCIGQLRTAWSVRVDTVSTLMFSLVTLISCLIYIYSATYMKQDKGRVRFIAYLSLFTFFMLVLVGANDLLQLFVGWEGVGIASYLLIGFWFHKPVANTAAIKAFLVNRIGDFALIIGLAGIFYLCGSLEYEAIFAAAPHAQTILFTIGDMEINALSVVMFLLVCGAMGKSAQFGLHVWLPDAMEGPTPVSALLHSATMVTAGVFLLLRLSPMLQLTEGVLMFIIVIGTLTALFAGSVALTQNDIKRVIAYSTCSQLGFMFVAVGVSAYAAAFFHLTTHAFFKSLLFLGSGSVIHAMAKEQDIQKMGGLRKPMGQTYWLMLIGTLSLVGTPYFSGAISKDTILEAAWGHHSWLGQVAYYACLAAIVFTALYSFRLIILTFYGKSRAPKELWQKVHESPFKMLWPLYILAFASIFLGIWAKTYFIGNTPQFWWKTLGLAPMDAALIVAHSVPWVHYLAVVAMVIGVGIAFGSYQFSNFAGYLSRVWRSLYQFLYNKWYFDELYAFLFVRPAYYVGYFLWRGIDQRVIDRFGPNGVAYVIGTLGQFIRKAQCGYLYVYAFVMFVAIALFLLSLVVL